MLYLAHADGYCKIGHTANDPAKRVGELQVGNPHQITLLAVAPGTLLDEGIWHRKFAHLRVHGEWFLLTIEHVVEFALANVADALPDITRPQPNDFGDNSPLDLEDLDIDFTDLIDTSKPESR